MKKNKNKNINIDADAVAQEAAQDSNEMPSAQEKDDVVYTTPPQRLRDLPGNEGEETTPVESPEGDGQAIEVEGGESETKDSLDDQSVAEEATTESPINKERDDIGEYFAQYVGQMPDIDLGMTAKLKLHEFLYQPVRVRFNYKTIAVISSAVAAVCLVATGVMAIFSIGGAPSAPPPQALVQGAGETDAGGNADTHEAVTPSETPVVTPEPTILETTEPAHSPPEESAHGSDHGSSHDSESAHDQATSTPAASPERSQSDDAAKLNYTNDEYVALDDAGKAQWAENRAGRIFNQKFGTLKKVETQDAKKDVFEDDVYRYTFDKTKTLPFESLVLISSEKESSGDVIQNNNKIEFMLATLSKILGERIPSHVQLGFGDDDSSFQIYHAAKDDQIIFSITFSKNNVLVSIVGYLDSKS